MLQLYSGCSELLATGENNPKLWSYSAAYSLLLAPQKWIWRTNTKILAM